MTRCASQKILLKHRNPIGTCWACGKEYVRSVLYQKTCLAPECESKYANRYKGKFKAWYAENRESFNQKRRDRARQRRLEREQLPPVMRQCAYCGEPFTPRPRFNTRQRFCSKRCLVRSIHARRAAEREARPKPMLECPVCGKTFVRNSGPHRFCSVECKLKGSPHVPRPHPPRVSRLGEGYIDYLSDLIAGEEEREGLTRRLDALEPGTERVALREELARLDKRLRAMRRVFPNKPKSHRRKTSNPLRRLRGGLTQEILDMLQRAGRRGLRVMDVARRLDYDRRYVNTWFRNAKRSQQVVHLARGHYAYAGGKVP